ncbi:MAG: hypothetical protein ACYSYM_09235, partial [Planctomycetota bacterium]
QLQRWGENPGGARLPFRLPTSITSTFFSANFTSYDTIKGLYFQVNYLAGSYNLALFNIKNAVLENLLRNLALTGRPCYTRGKTQVVFAEGLP